MPRTRGKFNCPICEGDMSQQVQHAAHYMEAMMQATHVEFCQCPHCQSKAHIRLSFKRNHTEAEIVYGGA